MRGAAFEHGALPEHCHDTEWGIPCHAYELSSEWMGLECMPAGLSWMLMLPKREIFWTWFADHITVCRGNLTNE